MVMMMMMQSCNKLNLLRGENTEISFTPIEIGLFCFCPIFYTDIVLQLQLCNDDDGDGDGDGENEECDSLSKFCLQQPRQFCLWQS